MKAADQGKTVTVVVTATKGICLLGSATSAGVVIKWDSDTSLSLSRYVVFGQTTTATVRRSTAGRRLRPRDR